MPVSAEEKKTYFAFIDEQVKTLQCLDIDRDTLVWHYTSGSALLSIVESGTLYATQVACLNDSTEVRYGDKLLTDAFIEIQSRASLQNEEAQFLEQIIKAGVEQSSLPHQPSDWFVTCFSTEKDDLSQWRAYSGGENGYAIAFLASAFFGRDSLVVRVNYDRDQHLLVAKNIAEATLRFFREGFDTRSGDERTSWTQTFLLEWSRLLIQLSPMVKDPAFRGENEYRIVHEFKAYEIGSLRFRQKQSLMSLHLPLVFPLPTATHSTFLPIVEVMVGPSRHKEISRMSVNVLLRQKGYHNTPVSLSTIPFQTT